MCAYNFAYAYLHNCPSYCVRSLLAGGTSYTIQQGRICDSSTTVRITKTVLHTNEFVESLQMHHLVTKVSPVIYSTFKNALSREDADAPETLKNTLILINSE